MEFWKGQALGNDYIVVDGTSAGVPATAAVRGLCDRHRGVGGDGVLVADLDADPIGLRIFNPDGTEAEKSGNGLRIFGAWLHGQGHVGPGPFRVALPGETVEMVVEREDEDATLLIRVDMGPVSFRAGDIPFADADPDTEVVGHTLSVAGEPMEINVASLGNPHCVVFVDPLDDDDFRRRAPALQAQPVFLEGVNVQFARPAGEALIDARIWERGVGETLASGSSSCAVVATARRTGRVTADRVRVRMPGGEVVVELDDAYRARLTGTAQVVFSGTVPGRVVAGW